MRDVLISVIIITLNRRNDLLKCLESLQVSDYKKIEIIVVDNGNYPPISSWLENKFKKLKIIRSDKNLGGSEGRNLGLGFAKGEYLLFIDDDVIIEKKMVDELASVLTKNSKVGIVQPKIYYLGKKGILQGIGCDINLLTGRVSTIGIREEDIGKYDYIKDLSAVGCIWMVKRSVIEIIGGYDPEYFFHYEDPDFSFRARRAGFKIYFVPTALAWHKGVKSTFIHPFIDYIGIRSADRAYRIARNKIIFMRKFSPFPKNIFFFSFFLPCYLIIHTILIIVTMRLDILFQYWLGVLSGLWYSLRYFLNYKKNINYET